MRDIEMKQSFYEIVLEGNFMMVRGFIIGFMAATKQDGLYFFHRKTGIRRETLKEFIREFFELENHTHFCLEADLIEHFKTAAKYYEKQTEMEVKSIKPIKGARFSFSYELYNENLAKKTKDILSQLPDGLNLKNYTPYESKDEEGKGMEGGYAPLHEFTSRGKGIVEGEFGGVIELFLKIKRSDLSESIICSDIDLIF
jgi:hypothetical protein